MRRARRGKSGGRTTPRMWVPRAATLARSLQYYKPPPARGSHRQDEEVRFYTVGSRVRSGKTAFGFLHLTGLPRIRRTEGQRFYTYYGVLYGIRGARSAYCVCPQFVVGPSDSPACILGMQGTNRQQKMSRPTADGIGLRGAQWFTPTTPRRSCPELCKTAQKVLVIEWEYCALLYLLPSGQIGNTD